MWTEVKKEAIGKHSGHRESGQASVLNVGGPACGETHRAGQKRRMLRGSVQKQGQQAVLRRELEGG